MNSHEQLNIHEYKRTIKQNKIAIAKIKKSYGVNKKTTKLNTHICGHMQIEFPEIFYAHVDKYPCPKSLFFFRT